MFPLERMYPTPGKNRVENDFITRFICVLKHFLAILYLLNSL